MLVVRQLLLALAFKPTPTFKPNVPAIVALRAVGNVS